MKKLRLVSPRVSHIGFLVWLILVSTGGAQYRVELVSPDFVQGSLPDGSVDKQTTGYTFYNKEPKGHWFVDYTFGGSYINADDGPDAEVSRYRTFTPFSMTDVLTDGLGDGDKNATGTTNYFRIENTNEQSGEKNSKMPNLLYNLDSGQGIAVKGLSFAMEGTSTGTIDAFYLHFLNGQLNVEEGDEVAFMGKGSFDIGTYENANNQQAHSVDPLVASWKYFEFEGTTTTRHGLPDDDAPFNDGSLTVETDNTLDYLHVKEPTDFGSIQMDGVTNLGAVGEFTDVWTKGGDLTIGGGGNYGSVAVGGEGNLDVGLSVKVGDGLGDSGLLAVSGYSYHVQGSGYQNVAGVMTLDGHLVLGGAGKGGLYVGHDGELELLRNTMQVYLGKELTGKGTMLVDGVGGIVRIGDRMTVGDNGVGIVRIQNGGGIVSNLVKVSGTATGDGFVRVHGAGSVLDSDTIEVGNTEGGAAEFVVLAGGVVQTSKMDIFSGGLVSGNGLIEGDIETLGGTLMPGDQDGVGVLDVTGEVTLGYESEISYLVRGRTAGSGYSQLEVVGDLVLSGTLKLRFKNNFAVQAGDEFVLMTATTMSGRFNAYDLPDIGPALAWDKSEVDSNGVLKVVSAGVNTVPIVEMTSPKASHVAIPSGVGVLLETAISDLEGDVLVYQWTLVSGAGEAIIVGSREANAEVTFSESGSYTLRLEVDDGRSLTALEITIEVATDAAPEGDLSNAAGVIHYAFGVASGTVVRDGFSEDHNGTIEGGVNPLESGALGTACRFDGVDDRVVIANSPDINNGVFEKRTVALWFKPDDLTGREILYEEGGVTRGLNIYLADAKLYVGGWNNGEQGWSETWLSTDLLDSDWHHVALVLDAPATGTATGALRMYLDGVLVDSGVASRLNMHVDGCALGSRNSDTKMHDGIPNFAHRYRGLIDEFLLYNRALGVDEIAGEVAQFGLLNQGAFVSLSGDRYTAAETHPFELTQTDGRLPEVGGVSVSIVQTSGPEAMINGLNSVTFTNEDLYGFRVIADDGEVKTYRDVQLTYAELAALAQYFEWILNHDLGPTGPVNPDDDPDSDGFVNLYEYAGTGVPTQNDGGGMSLFAVSDTTVDGEIFVTLKVRRRRDYLARGLTYVAKRSVDLTTWSEIGIVFDHIDGVDAQFEDVVYRVTTPINTENSKAFFRLEVMLDGAN